MKALLYILMFFILCFVTVYMDENYEIPTNKTNYISVEEFLEKEGGE